MRRLILALVALAFATAATAATPAGPYQTDKQGRCHAANGEYVAKSNCATMAATPMTPVPKHCKDPKTHKFVKCGTPGAVPA